MKTYILLASMLLAGVIPMRAEIEDDIYYNPKNAAHESNQPEKRNNRNGSNYIADYQNSDVDVYNSRGQYYTMPVDTIGYGVENAPDFVYTTKIQKYYNPTIVVDNEEMLAEVLENSYGNVTIEYNINGIPTFSNWVSPWYWSTAWTSPYFGWNINWYNPWYWGPSYSWNWGWGPSWTWGPSWNWGWGPSWSWGGYYPYYRPYYASYRPGGNRGVSARPGWSHNRPGYASNHNYSRPGNHNYGRPGNHNYGRPGSSSVSGGGNNSGYYGRQPGQGAYSSTRPGGSTSSDRYNNGATRPGNSSGSNRGGYTIGNDGHRYINGGNSTGSGSYGTGNGNRNQNSTYTRPGSSTNRNYNSGSSSRPGSSNRSYNSGTTTRNSGSSTRSYNSGSSNSGSRSSGNYGGSRGGGSRGGGSRGGRR